MSPFLIIALLSCSSPKTPAVYRPSYVPAPILTSEDADPCIPRDACCKICVKGQACGDSCIATNRQCTSRGGCACNEEELCE